MSQFLKKFLIVGLILVVKSVSVQDQSCVYARSPDEEVAHFYRHAVYDPHRISEDALYARVEAEYRREKDFAKRNTLANRLLTLKWWRLWEANFEMAPETAIVADPLKRYFQPSENWQWTVPLSDPFSQKDKQERLHYSTPVGGIARHRVHGVFPYILPVNGTLLQHVYFPEDKIAEQLLIRIETGYVGHPQQQHSVFVQARWTKVFEPHLSTENRPSNFWAGSFARPSLQDENGGAWYTLKVDLVDLGLCGRNRIIRGVEFIAVGGQAWFGKTVIQRPQVEIRGTQKYHLFSVEDELVFDVTVHNFLPSEEHYTLNLTISDYHGSTLQQSEYSFVMSGKASHHETLVINPADTRYLVLEYTLNKGQDVISHGYSAAAIILSNRTGRKVRSKFGMMYWDQPGMDMVRFYEKLGVKLVVIFPQTERLHLFDSQTFEIMPMFWALPDRSPKEGTRLQQHLQPYLQAGQRIFSNFWETDLRVPPELFAPNMRKFTHLIKQLEPAALVGIGGLAWFNVAYLTQLLQGVEHSQPFFDFIAVMCYNTPSPPEFSGIEQESAAFVNLLETHGIPETEIWNVEWSYFDTLNLDSDLWLNTGVPRESIASYTIRHHLLGFASGIKRMVPGTSLHTGRPPLAKNYGHSMSLGRNSVLRYDLTPLPTLPAYSVMTRMLQGKEYSKSFQPTSDLFCQIYRAVDESYTRLASSKTVLVVWSLSEMKNIALRLAHDSATPENVTIMNMIGERSQQSTYNGELHISVTPEPTYILLDKNVEEVLEAIEIALAEPMLSATLKKIEVPAGEASNVAVTYRIFNPGKNALRVSVRLIPATGVHVLDTEVRYLNEIGRQLAPSVLSYGKKLSADDKRETEEFWLGRYHHVDVTYNLAIPAGILRKAYYEQVELTRQDVFHLVAELISDQQVLARTMTPVHRLPSLKVSLRPGISTKDEANTPNVHVQIENTSSVLRQGTLQMKVPVDLQITPRHTSFLLHPGETRTYNFSLKGIVREGQNYTHEVVDTKLDRRSEQVVIQQNQTLRLDHYRKESGYLFSFGVGEGYVIEALVNDQMGYETRQSRGFAFRPAVKSKQPITIDGDLNDWRDAAPLFLPPEGRLSGLTFFAKDYGGEMQWTGRDDFSSAWQMMWDEEWLYLAVRVFDDQVIPQYNLGQFWNGDSISFQIDPQANLTDASILPMPRNLQDIHTFDVGLSRQGPNMRRKYATAQHPAGTVERAKVAMKQVSDGLLYELAIPWQELSPLSPEDERWMGFSLVLYEDDGFGRETRCNWFGGSGGNGLAREPRLMGDVHFVP